MAAVFWCCPIFFTRLIIFLKACVKSSGLKKLTSYLNVLDWFDSRSVQSRAVWVWRGLYTKQYPPWKPLVSNERRNKVPEVQHFVVRVVNYDLLGWKQWDCLLSSLGPSSVQVHGKHFVVVIASYHRRRNYKKRRENIRDIGPHDSWVIAIDMLRIRISDFLNKIFFIKLEYLWTHQSPPKEPR